MGMQLNTGDTGRAVTAAADGSMYANILGNGCYVLSNGSQFASAVQSNNKIKISDGDLMMQGRHAWIPTSDSQIMTIDNGASGYNRIDLITARYKKDSTGKEDITLVVIKGTATTGTPSEPSCTSGDIRSGATQKDFPLYAVRLTGINITAVTKKFTVLDTIAALQTAVSQLNSNLNWKYIDNSGKNYVDAIDFSKYSEVAFSVFTKTDFYGSIVLPVSHSFLSKNNARLYVNGWNAGTTNGYITIYHANNKFYSTAAEYCNKINNEWKDLSIAMYVR